jgi:hypothetical protein
MKKIRIITIVILFFIQIFVFAEQKNESIFRSNYNLLNTSYRSLSVSSSLPRIGNYEYIISTEKETWHDVQKLCKEAGDGWFIPSEWQVLLILQSLNVKYEDYFWTSEEKISDPNNRIGSMYAYDAAVTVNSSSKINQNNVKYKSEKLNVIVARSLGNNFENVKSQLSSAYTIGDLLVSKEELHSVTYDQAIGLCQKLGNGWRLPTIEELEKIKSNGRTCVKDLSYNDYFSSTRSCDNCFDSYCTYNINTSKRGVNDKRSVLRVIPVYSNPKEQIKTWKFSQYEVIPQFYGPMTLNEAKSYCLNMSDNPNRQWRIANMQELSSMLQYKNEISGIVGKTFMSYTPGKSRSDSRQDLEIVEIAPIGQAQSYWMTGNAENKYYFFIVR